METYSWPGCLLPKRAAAAKSLTLPVHCQVWPHWNRTSLVPMPVRSADRLRFVPPEPAHSVEHLHSASLPNSIGFCDGRWWMEPILNFYWKLNFTHIFETLYTFVQQLFTTYWWTNWNGWNDNEWNWLNYTSICNIVPILNLNFDLEYCAASILILW